eukprot:6239827-Alexandrium_andersonii.AAC.1
MSTSHCLYSSPPPPCALAHRGQVDLKRDCICDRRGAPSSAAAPAASAGDEDAEAAWVEALLQELSGGGDIEGSDEAH